MANDNFSVANLATAPQFAAKQPTTANAKAAATNQNEATANAANATNANNQPDVAKLKEQHQIQQLESQKSLLENMFAKGQKGDAKAMQIFYQEAASAIEGFLKKEFGDDFSLEALREKTSGIEGQEDYWSSENTADRIVTFATSYFETFKKQNPKLSDEEAMDKYMNLISPALEKGMGEAVDILRGFGAYNGHIKDTAEETQRLVFEKLEAFRANRLGLNEEPAEKEQPLFDDANIKEETGKE